MKRKRTFDRGIETVSEFGALAHYDEIWLVDRRDYITECGALTSYGEIWLVESQDRTTALVIADSKEASDSELREYRRGQRHRLTPASFQAIQFAAH